MGKKIDGIDQFDEWRDYSIMKPPVKDHRCSLDLDMSDGLIKFEGSEETLMFILEEIMLRPREKEMVLDE